MRSRDILLLGALAACGGGTALPDAAVDATNDAPLDAPDEATRVTVTTYTSDGTGDLDPTAIVIFSDTNGTVIQHGPVDANSQAWAYMPGGGTVTALHTRNDPSNLFQRTVRLTTFRGVQPGDELRTGRSKILVKREGDFEVMQASYTSINPAAGPYMLGACAEPGLGNPKPVVFYDSCVTPTFDLLTIADEQNTNVRKYVWQDDVPFVADGDFTVPNAWQPMEANTTTFLNVPANLQRVAAILYSVIDGVPIELDRDAVELPPSTASTSLLHAALPTPMVLVAQTVQGINTLERYVVATNGSAADLTIDWATLVVPRPTVVQQNPAGLTWTVTPAGTPDARVLFWNARWMDGNNVQRTVYWDVIESSQGPASCVLPSLPTEYAADDPTINTVMLTGAGLRYVDYDNLPTYDAARPLGPEIVWVEHLQLSTDHRARVSFAATL